MFGINIVSMVIAAIVIAILVTLGYYIMRFLRGSINILMQRTAFAAGEEITGELTLQTKKLIEGNRLLVSLVGKQITESRNGEGHRRTQTREIYRDDRIIEEAQVYPAGGQKNYRFALRAPGSAHGDGGNSGVSKMILDTLSLMSSRNVHIKWSIEARLDAKGVDLASSKRISIDR